MSRSDSQPGPPSPPPRLRFTPAQRLRKPHEFQRVYDGRQRAGDERLLIFAAPNDLGWTRIGLSVSRKQGNSVRRHQLKRLLREAFRLSQHELPTGLDLILIPRAEASAGVAEYRESLLRLTDRLARRLRRGAAASPPPAAPPSAKHPPSKRDTR
jgi:ribonuclease P protein component